MHLILKTLALLGWATWLAAGTFTVLEFVGGM